MLERLPAASLKPPVFGSAAVLPHPVNTPTDAFTPRFGAVATAPVAMGSTALLPPESVVVLVPGLGAPASSMQHLESWFNSHGHKAQTLEIPQIRIAGNLADAAQSLARQIDGVRLDEARPRLQRLSQQLAQTPDPAARRALLQKTFALDNSPAGLQTLSAVEALLSTDLVPRVLGMANQPEYSVIARQWLSKLPPDMQKTTQPKLDLAIDHLDDWRWMPKPCPLSSAITQYRQAFQQRLNITDPDLKEKITNHVFDTLVPRVVLVGHSLGGVAGLKTLQDNPEGDNPIAETLTLSSPVNGVGVLPKLPQSVETFYLAQLAENSPLVQGMRHNPLPLDTAAISICNPKDGAVKPDDTKLNEDITGSLNLKVAPSEAKTLLSLLTPVTQRLINLLPPLRWLADKLTGSVLMKRTRTHCGLLENCEHNWTQGGEFQHKLFGEKDSADHLARLLTPQGNEALQVRLLQTLRQRLHEKPHERGRFQSLIPVLQRLTAKPLPFTQSTDKLAADVLAELVPQPATEETVIETRLPAPAPIPARPAFTFV